MSDEVLTVKLTAREIDLIHQCISTNIETVKRRHDPTDPMIGELIQELGELSDDLLEQRFNPEDLSGRTFAVAEDDFIHAGIDAREQLKEKMREVEAEREQGKASSRAAARRTLNFSGQPKDRKLSKTQTHDVWDANDPKNW